MSSIKLNFINLSNDANNSKIVIFQKNEVPAFSEIALAWKVINNCGAGDNHPFEFPLDMQLAASDSWGNYTPQMPASPGDSFEMIRTSSGDQLVTCGHSNSVVEVEVKNNLNAGSINAWIYKGGTKLAVKTNVVPGQMAAFVFKPCIYIGVVSQVEEGQVMDSAILSQVNTQFSLLGIASADIVLTGGGSGSGSQPFRFSLRNVQMA